MTEQIMQLKQAQWDKQHVSARKSLPEGSEAAYRVDTMKDYTRTANRLRVALEAETPYLFDNEIFAFTRTVPNLPKIYSEKEWRKSAVATISTSWAT